MGSKIITKFINPPKVGAKIKVYMLGGLPAIFGVSHGVIQSERHTVRQGVEKITPMEVVLVKPQSEPICIDDLDYYLDCSRCKII